MEGHQPGGKVQPPERPPAFHKRVKIKPQFIQCLVQQVKPVAQRHHPPVNIQDVTFPFQVHPNSGHIRNLETAMGSYRANDRGLSSSN